MTKLSLDTRVDSAQRIAFMFIEKVRSKMDMGSIFTDVPIITPDNANPLKLKEAAAAPAPAQSAPAPAPAPANENGGGRSRSPKRKQNQTAQSGTVTPPSTKKEPKEMGFFVPEEGCDYKKMFAGIGSPDGTTKVPCFNHHAIGHECTHGRQCHYLHGSFIRFPQAVQKKILDNMLEHKMAHFNPKMTNSNNFKSIVGDNYDQLWKTAGNSDAAEGA